MYSNLITEKQTLKEIIPVYKREMIAKFKESPPVLKEHIHGDSQSHNPSLIMRKT